MTADMHRLAIGKVGDPRGLLQFGAELVGNLIYGFGD